MTGRDADTLVIGVAVAGQPLDGAVTDALESTRESVAAESFPTAAAAAARAKGGHIHGVVLGEGLDADPAELRRVSSAVDTPVVLLSDEPAEELVSGALEGEITDLFPRLATETQCELVVRRIANERPSKGGETNGFGDRKRLNRAVNGTFGSPDEQFQVVVENLDEAIFVSKGLINVPDLYADETDVELEYISPRYEDIWGRSLEELYHEPRTFVEAIHPDDEDDYYETLHTWVNEAREGHLEANYSTDFRIRRPDGEIRWVTVTATPVPLEGENHHRWVGTIKDITQRRRREREFEQIFNGVIDPIAVYDPDTLDLLDANEAFLDMIGQDDVESFQEEGIAEHMATEEGYTVERGIEIHQRAHETGTPQTVDWKGRTADGDDIWLEVKNTPAVIGGERVTIASMRDVTERRRRQREYEQIFNGVEDPITVHDPETAEVIEVNEGFCELMGYSREQLLEMGVEGWSTDGDAYTLDQAREFVRSVVESGDPKKTEWIVETVDGERRLLEIKGTATQIGGELRYVSICRDITERKRRERMIRALHDATDRFQDAETRQQVCEATVEAAEAVLDLQMPACWLPAEDETRLEPAAATETAWETPGGLEVFEAGSFEYDIYEGDELVTFDPRQRWDRPAFEWAFLVPLGDHGLLGAADPDRDAFDEVTLDAARILAGHATSALDRVERARELRESERRFRTIAERVDEVIYLANPDDGEVLYINDAYTDIWGRPVSELYEDPMAFTEAIHPNDVDSFMAEREAMLSDIRNGDPDESYDFSYRIERPDGELRWIESTGYPLLGDEDRPNRYVAMVEDVTDRVRREQTLETFHEATRELTDADSKDVACRQAVRAAEDVLGFPHVSAHLYEESTGCLEPTSTTGQLAELDVELPTIVPGDSLPWQVYVEGESVTSTGQEDDVFGPGVSGPDVILPLGSHGVMLVGDPTGSFDDEDIELAQILAATLEAALNHVAGERALADREAELRRHQERANRLERLNDVIRDIERATVEHSSRAAIEEAVCEYLESLEGNDVVWIAELSVGDDPLVPRTSAGEKGGYLDALTVDTTTGAGSHPAVRAHQQTEPQVVESVATDVTAGDWRKTALRHGIQSAVAVPIRHEGTVHGILIVESTDPDAFDAPTREVLADLGRSIGYAITVTERERALESEGTTEVEFSIDDEGLFMVRGARAASCDVELERTVRRTGGSFSTFYTVEGAPPSELVELATAAPSVESAQVLSSSEDDDAGLIEVTGSTWFGSPFSEYGAVVREATASPDGGTLIVEAPHGSDVRALVEALRERYPDVEFVAQRQRERTIPSLFELQDVLKAELTDKQWEALETAYSAGYFGWPRKTSGEEVAELLGVTQPTFNKHLRFAEQAAFEMLLERGRYGANE